jgi:isopropylmalate/homocitrate/citramalate synthase
MLDEPAVYEAYAPEQYGGERRLLFGPSSGLGAARRLLERAGVEEPSDDLVEEFLSELRALDQHVPYDAAVQLAEDSVA